MEKRFVKSQKPRVKKGAIVLGRVLEWKDPNFGR